MVNKIAKVTLAAATAHLLILSVIALLVMGGCSRSPDGDSVPTPNVSATRNAQASLRETVEAGQ